MSSRQSTEVLKRVPIRTVENFIGPSPVVGNVVFSRREGVPMRTVANSNNSSPIARNSTSEFHSRGTMIDGKALAIAKARAQFNLYRYCKENCPPECSPSLERGE